MEMFLDGLSEALHLVLSGDAAVLHAVVVSLSCKIGRASCRERV